MFRILSTVLFCGLTLASGAGCAVAGPTSTTDSASLTDREQLGQLLFEDTNLSEPPGQSCATCHDPGAAFTGNDGSSIDAVARGAGAGELGSRNVPTLMYAMYSPSFDFVFGPLEQGGEGYTPTGGLFWDGRAASLEEQARGPLLNPREMGNPDVATVVAKVRDADYADQFRAVYGPTALDDDASAFEHIVEAIASFERSDRFRPFSSRFDDFLRGTATPTEAESRGFAIFASEERGNCIGCHFGDTDSPDPEDWMFTDFTYDNIGVPRNEEIPDNADPTHYDLGLCAQEGLADGSNGVRAPDGFDVDSLCGAFKVPTLRNIAVTAPYMHNGVFGTLEEAVRFYSSRNSHPERWYPEGPDGAPLLFDDVPARYRDNVNTTVPPLDTQRGLTDNGIADLVAFLETLTDREFLP